MNEIKFLGKYFNNLKTLLSNENYYHDLIKIKEILYRHIKIKKT